MSGTGRREPVWPGSWVADRLGVGLVPTGPRVGPEFSTDVTGTEPPGRLGELVGLALRRNPRRAHLLVSTVLGKHVPRPPHVVHGAGLALGARVAAVLPPPGAGPAPVVLGYAETATGLGHCVAEALRGSTCLHSTRRAVPGVEPAGGFEEEHSHATSHLLLPADPHLLHGDGPLVLVDDELSTGRTVLNTIRTLHARAPRERYVIAALIDVRGPQDRAHLAEFAAGLGTRVDTVALAEGLVRLPADVLTRGQRIVAEHEPATPVRHGDAAAPVTRLGLDWPADLPDGGRHGFTPEHAAALDRALPHLAAQLAGRLTGRRILVLGSEELMYAPLRLARALAEQVPDGVEVRFSTTTRSPVLAVDDPGYAIRTRLEFPAHDDPSDGFGPRYAYNVAPGSAPGRRFDMIVPVVDSVGDTPALHAPGGLLDTLSRVTDHVGVVVIPSYAPTHAPSARGGLPA